MHSDVNRHFWKPHRPIRMLLEEGHGNEFFFADMHGHSQTCPRTIGSGSMDDKDAPRTIRTRFKDRFVFSHTT